MKNNITKKALVIFLLSFNGLFAQLSLKEISLQEQIDNSTLVVEGEVVSKHSFWNNNLIYTANTIKVYKVFKGEYVATIDVITLGGTVGFRALIANPSLILNVDDIGVFMLESSNVKDMNLKQKSNKNVFKPYGSKQGFYKYNLRDNLAVNPFNKIQGIKSMFYNEIKNITKKNYVDITSFNADFRKVSNQAKVTAPGSLTLNKSVVTAGTKDVLTITGSGFGAIKGKVWFSNSDDGGATYISALDTQVTWSDTSITVEVPSKAGTGPIFVEDSSNAQSPLSSSLTVSYAEINLVYDIGSGDEAFQTQHFNENTSGGYTWEMQTDFFNDTEHPGAKAAFENAFNEWVCQTGINWTISGTPTTTDVIGVADLSLPFDGELDDDDENVIRFDNGSELDTGVLGTCYSWWGSCNGSDWYVTSLDIVFDSETNWYFGAGLPGLSEYDFQSVALHELGHGHQLDHVIDPTFDGDNIDDVMHYAISNSEQQRVLSANNITAANNVQNRSTSSMVCGQPVMTDASCPLSVEDNILKDAVKIYPNPSNGEFYINSESYINLTKAVVHDLSGRVISEFDISGTSKTKTIDLVGLSKGIYLVKIHSDKAFATKKLVLE